MYFKHLRGQHDQRDHGRRGRFGVFRSNLGGGGSGGEESPFLTSVTQNLPNTSPSWGWGPINPDAIVSRDEGYSLRKYDETLELINPSEGLFITRASQMPETFVRAKVKNPQSEVNTQRKTVADYVREKKEEIDRKISRSGSVSASELLGAEYLLNKARVDVRKHVEIIKKIQEGEMSDDRQTQLEFARGALIEAYVQSEAYREVYNRGLAERMQTTPHPTQPLFLWESRSTSTPSTSNPQGYVPSLRAMNITKSMNDPNHPFSKQLDQLLSDMRNISDERGEIFVELDALADTLSQTSDPPQKSLIREKIQRLRDRLSSFTVDESQIHRDVISALQSLGLTEQSQGKINSRINVLLDINTLLTPSTSIGSARQQKTSVERVTRERLRFVETILQHLIPHPELGLPEQSPVTINVDMGGVRAFADVQKNSITISPRDGTRVILHEIFHLIEQNNPRLSKRSLAFYSIRTRQSEEEPLSNFGNYDDDEFTKVDNFAHPYIGKSYSRGTELISIFSDYIMLSVNKRKEHQLQIREDSEYMHFVLDALMDPQSYQP